MPKLQSGKMDSTQVKRAVSRLQRKLEAHPEKITWANLQDLTEGYKWLKAHKAEKAIELLAQNTPQKEK